MRELSILDRARRILNAAGMDDYGDGMIVTDIVVGYAEPGYHNAEAVIAFGDWNDNGKWDPVANRRLAPTKAETLPSRLARALETAGCEIEWSDEWAQCGDCYRAIRTQADSYSWTPSYAWVGECDIVCADCLRTDPSALVEEYVNNADKAFTFFGAAELMPLGFVHLDERYENGWHEGQDDKPADVLARILADDDNAEVVFTIDGVGQFDMRFSAWVRTTTDDDDQEEETS